MPQYDIDICMVVRANMTYDSAIIDSNQQYRSILNSPTTTFHVALKGTNLLTESATIGLCTKLLKYEMSFNSVMFTPHCQKWRSVSKTGHI